MWFRRSLYYAQFPFAILVPAWVLVSRGILFDGIGAQLVVYIVVCPVVTLALIAVSAIIFARKSVREDKAVSSHDAALQVSIWVSLIVFGLVAYPLLAVLAALLVIWGFWWAMFELFNETRARVKAAWDLGPTDGSIRRPSNGPRQIPDLIVVPPDRSVP